MYGYGGRRGAYRRYRRYAKKAYRYQSRARKYATRSILSYPGRLRAGNGTYRSYLNPRSGGYNGQEWKYFDSEYGPTVINVGIVGGEADPAGALSLNSIAQGDGPTQRDGRRVILQKITVHGRIGFINVNVSQPGSAVIRFMLVLDTQTNGQQLNAEDVLEVPTTAIEPLAMHNLSWSQRFRVLWDRTWSFEPRGLAFINAVNQYTTNSKRNFSFTKKLNLVVNYSGTTGVIGSVTDNSLHVVCFLDDGASGVGSVSYVARVRFTD